MHEVSLLPRFGFVVDRSAHQNAKDRRLTSRRKTVFNMYDGYHLFGMHMLWGFF